MTKLPNIIFIGIIYIFSSGLYAQSLTLKQALSSALANNPVIKTGSFDPLIADADIITAGIRPNLKLNNQTLMLVDPPYFAPGVSWPSNRNRQDWWQLTKVIQWPGQRKWKINTSLSRKLMATHQFSEMERNIMLDVAEKYLEVWSDLKQLLILNESKLNIDSLVVVNYDRFQKKQVKETDYLRTQILSDECAIQISETALQLQTDMRSLQFLTGIKDSLSVDTSLHIINLNFDPDSLIAEAFKYRPDLLGSQAQIDFSMNNIKLQKRLAFPSLDFGLIWNPQNTVQYVGFIATMELPVFDRNQGEIKKSYISKTQSEQNLIAIKEQVNTDVLNAYNEFNNKKNNVLKYRVIFSKTELILDEIRDNYSKGETDIIDFLEAQRSWIEAKNYYVDLQYKYYRSYINLLYHAGRIQLLILN